jgi:hypothetical protein
MDKILKVTHNAAFFSCCSIRLYEIINYFNSNKELPEIVDSSEQFQILKNSPGDLTNYFFETSEDEIIYEKDIIISDTTDEIQFSNYDLINFNKVNPFVEKYFKPSHYVLESMNFFIEKYSLNFENLCGVFYRGLDKSRETTIASYDVYIDKCRDIKNTSNVKFWVQTDETEFLKTFLQNFPDSVVINEMPTLAKSDSLVTHHISPNERLKFGIEFLAITLLLSKCKYLVTHSGNCGHWSCLFRGNTNNVYQWVTSSRNREFNPNQVEFNYWNK